MASFNLTGLSSVLGNLQAIGQSIEEQAGKALYQEGVQLKEASDEDCPVLTGDLLNSGYIEQNGLVVTVGYRESYAAKVHEDLSVHHPHGHAKFLERPLHALEPRLADNIAGQVRL